MDTDSPTPASAAYDALRAAWMSEGGLPYKERMRLLKSLARGLRAKRDDLAGALTADYGSRSAFETVVGEVFIVLEGIKHARNHLRDWMEPREVDVAWQLKPARARVVRQPLGVVGVISPWNYPIQLCIGPLVGALAAGNRVLIKTSELTPHTNKVLEQLITDTLPDTVVRMVHGGADVGQAVSSLPLDHLLFTGSTRVGKLVMAAAAEHLTPVTLELGGKSPAIVHPSFSVNTAAQRIVWGKMFNSGQTCVAPDYVLVARDQGPAFIEAAKAAYSSMYPKMVDNPDHTAIITERHFQRLQRLVEDARERGVEVVEAGSEGPHADSRKCPLTLLVDPPADSLAMDDEIFGPVLPIVYYDDLEAALAQVAKRSRPLALYYFDRSRRRIDDILTRTISGGVGINECLVHLSVEDLPFGGVGGSGMGSYHGEAGFLTFSHEKSVLVQSRFSLMPVLNPPYGTIAKWFAKIMTAF